MKLQLKKLILFIFISSIIVGCETCDDCGPVGNYPYFNLSIFNRTSLDTLKQDSSRYELESSNLGTLIMNLETAIENDTLDMESELIAQKESLEILDSINNDSLIIIKNKIRDINNRLISIDSINDVADLFRQEDDESDSLTSFRFPLDAGANVSIYKIKIGQSSITKSMTVSYTLQDTVINNRITKTAKNLQILDDDFISISGPPGCTPIINCSSNQLNIDVEI